jgi:cytochrome c biogenesis protein CcdA
MGDLMKKFVLLMLLFFVGIASAASATDVSYFYSYTCGHCENVAESGILEQVNSTEGVEIVKYEVTNPVNREKFLSYIEMFGVERAGVPFLVIEQDGEFSYLAGDTPIIENLNDSIINFRPHVSGDVVPVYDDLGLWVVVGAALVDSVNPCAFGVLLFLMAVLLSMGSAKRAFRSGMVYTFVIFLVYLAAGLGIMRFAGGFLASFGVRTFVGIVVLVGGLIELKDFFWEGKGISLKIPDKVKPSLEKHARKGGLVSLIVLGVLVALVELPCTGGIYLAILSLIADSGALGMFYLVLYNVIFVLPLILISYFVYRGAKADNINDWVQKNKRFMRLAAGIVMVGLALSLLGVF